MYTASSKKICCLLTKLLRGGGFPKKSYPKSLLGYLKGFLDHSYYPEVENKFLSMLSAAHLLSWESEETDEEIYNYIAVFA